MLREGIYQAEHNESMTDKYLIKIKLKETEKSYIFELLEFDSRYPPAQMEMFFKNSNRVVLRKDKGGHAMRVWGEDSFTFYPYQAGIPFVFNLIDPPKETPNPIIKGFTLSEKEYKDKYCSHKSGMREDELKAIILEFVKSQARLAVDLDDKASKLMARKTVQPTDSAQVRELRAEIKRCEFSSKEVFERFLLGDLTEREYTEETERLATKSEEYRAQLEKAENGAAKTVGKTVKENSYVQMLKTLTRARALTREICVELISRIDIDKDHNVQIIVKYKDLFADLARKIEETEAD